MTCLSFIMCKRGLENCTGMFKLLMLSHEFLSIVFKLLAFTYVMLVMEANVLYKIFMIN